MRPRLERGRISSWISTLAKLRRRGETQDSGFWMLTLDLLQSASPILERRMSRARDSFGPVKEMLGGLHRSGTALITKGTAMGALVPLLLLVPIFGVFAYLFRDLAVVGDVPTFSAFFVAGIAIIIVRYLVHYARFAREDPDRLQSEKYRLDMEQLEVQRVLAAASPSKGRGFVGRCLGAAVSESRCAQWRNAHRGGRRATRGAMSMKTYLSAIATCVRRGRHTRFSMTPTQW